MTDRGDDPAENDQTPKDQRRAEQLRRAWNIGTDEQRRGWTAGAGIAIGAGVGAALGAATGEMAIWLPVGIAVGLALAVAIGSRWTGQR